MKTTRATLRIMVLAVIMLLGLAACGDAAPAAPTATLPVATTAPEPTNTTAAADPTATTAMAEEEPTEDTSGSSDGWQTYTNEEGNFSVLLPEEPEEGEQTTDTDLGELSFKTFVVSQGATAYTVTYVDYPESVSEADPQTLLDAGFASIAGQSPEAEATKITVQGHPGMTTEFEEPSGQGFIRYKAVLVKNRLYQIISVTPEENDGGEDAQRFQDSFELIEE